MARNCQCMVQALRNLRAASEAKENHQLYCANYGIADKKSPFIWPIMAVLA